MDEIKFLPISGELESTDKQTMVNGMLAYHASQGLGRKLMARVEAEGVKRGLHHCLYRYLRQDLRENRI